ncbi:hypothetical protein MHBO_000516 [Bonamia ostreae]|uniref:Uncharacterized protein n=1 Tax=Bonamia ostreae TaxID=126728 RepID=A0ABV2AGP8_9EUKA
MDEEIKKAKSHFAENILKEEHVNISSGVKLYTKEVIDFATSNNFDPFKLVEKDLGKEIKLFIESALRVKALDQSLEEIKEEKAKIVENVRICEEKTRILELQIRERKVLAALRKAKKMGHEKENLDNWDEDQFEKFEKKWRLRFDYLDSKTALLPIWNYF